MKLDVCSFEAAKAAVMRWHYSRCMPSGKLLRFGVWGGDDDSRFDGVVLYGRGASLPLYKSFGAKQTELVELVRVALRDADERDYPTSRVVATSLRLLRKTNPGVGLVVSFADFHAQGHPGTIYQATNWLYLGKTGAAHYFDKRTGALVHSRTVGTWAPADPRRKSIEKRVAPKYRYAYPFTKAWAKKLAPKAQPYPTRESPVGESGIQPGTGGSSPTLALHPDRS